MVVSETSQQPSAMRPRVVLLYPYYWPTYKAGGPVQSLFNLAGFYKEHADFYVISLAKDIDGTAPDVPVKLNAWAKGPNHENIFFVSRITPLVIERFLKTTRPDRIFINGLFNIETSLPGLLFARLRGIPVIISPRGMLQAWGLKKKYLLKRTVLALFRFLMGKNAVWHATDQQEVADIQFHFGKSRKIFVAPNIPRAANSHSRGIDLQPGNKITLVFLSLINPNKNLHLVIDAVKKLPEKFSLDIYGPVIDQQYWSACQQSIGEAPHIHYRGPVPAWQVPDILSRFHFFVLPTQGENFGHAIFDALVSGVPVMISRNTPWHDVEASGAGFYLPLDDPKAFGEVLMSASKMQPKDYEAMKAAASAYAERYWSATDYHKLYSFLLKGDPVPA